MDCTVHTAMQADHCLLNQALGLVVRILRSDPRQKRDSQAMNPSYICTMRILRPVGSGSYLCPCIRTLYYYTLSILVSALLLEADILRDVGNI